MKNSFVNTSNVARFMSAVSDLQNRGAGEACLMVVDGHPGLSKTTICHWWAIQNNAVFLRAKAEWTPRWMVRELLESMNVKPRHSFQDCFRQAVDALMSRSNQAQIQGKTFAVIIDEVDHIGKSAKCLETLRDFSDLLEIPFIFVGMQKVRDNISRFPQISSRIGQYVEFFPASRDDVYSLVNELCEVEVGKDLIEFLLEVSRGRVREVKEAIMAIERFGKRNNGTVTRKAMAGETLLNSRDNGQPIKVRAD
ncbi:ATP-binding protein [Emcibacter sp.]|uniref:ATP-binding protein n=1 Tax=Emcibacter sp. TaxID=1979954 RepID=UPI002AA8CEF8|nr:ATP-binding protein [Emcibacter sp.]